MRPDPATHPSKAIAAAPPRPTIWAAALLTLWLSLPFALIALAEMLF